MIHLILIAYLIGFATATVYLYRVARKKNFGGNHLDVLLIAAFWPLLVVLRLHKCLTQRVNK